jgi:hypothetical protein
MPPSLPKVPFSSGGHSGFRTPDSAWAPIEVAYGQTLPSRVRQEIVAATAHFVDMAAVELEAPPAMPAKRRVERLRKSARKLADELTKCRTFKPNSPELWADELIFQHLRLPPLDNGQPRPTSVHLAPGLGYIAKFISACDAAKNEMNEMKLRYWRAGSAWNDWIKALTKIMTKHDLPIGASGTVATTNSDPDDWRLDLDYPPFTAFMRALQQQVPANVQKHMCSDAALAGAINRARREP